MDFGYTSEQKTLRDEIIRFARQELSDGVIERDRDQEFSREGWKQCAEMGLLALPVPTEQGGSGLDALSSAIALEALGYGCQDGGLVFSIVAHMVSCVVPLWKHGSPQHRDKYLRGLCDGTLIGVHAMTEPDSGSDAFAMRTRAEPDGDGWVINGSKVFISNGPIADVVIVFAITDSEKGFHGGVSSFLLERGHPGFAVSQKLEKMGLRTSPLGELNFENVRVGPESLVGGLGGGSRMFTLAMDWERTCLFAAQVGVMERLLDTSVKYARSRRQFGQPIGKFQGVSHKIADMKVSLEAARLLVYKAAWALDNRRSVTMDTSIAKLFVSENLVKSALDAVQVHGGYGYMTEYEVERMLRDAVGSRIYSGTSEMQRNIIAGWLGL